MSEQAAPPASATAIPSSVIRKNVTVLGLAYAVAGLAGLIAQAILARHVTRADFGLYIAALSLVTIARVVHMLGGTEYIVREGARDSARIGPLIGDVLVLTAGTTFAVVALTAGAAAALGFRASGVAAAAMLALTSGAGAASGALRSGLQCIERLELSAAISIGISVSTATAVAAAAVAGWGIAGAAAAGAAVAILAVPVAWIVVRARVAVRVRPSMDAARTVARASLPFAAVGVFLFAANYVDTLVIRGVRGEHDTAIYGAAYRIFVVVGWLPIVFANAVYRTLSNLAARARDQFPEFVERASAGMLVAALPLAAGGAIVGERLVPLVFGDGYANAAPILRILMGALPFAFPGVLLISAVVLGDRPRVAGKILAAGFGLNLVANLATVPRYGIAASAWITVATEAFLTVAATRALARDGVRARWPLAAARAVPAVAVMSAAVWPLRDASLAIPIAVGAITYAGACLVLGVPARLRWRRDSAGPTPEPAGRAAAIEFSVVVPTYARTELLTRCLSGIAAQTLPPAEIVVVHRRDDLPTVALLDEWRHEDPVRHRTVAVDRPGLIPALDAGTRVARSPVVAFLDDDAVPRPEWLAEVAPAFVDPRVGAAGGPIVDHDNGRVVEGTASRVGRVTWYGRVIGRHDRRTTYEGPVDWLTGSNMALRAELIRHDPELAHTHGGLAMCNDLDTCLTVRRAGYSIAFTPRAIVDHDRTSFRDPALGTHLARDDIAGAAANRTYVLAKHASARRRAVVVAYGLIVGSSSLPGPARVLAEVVRSPRRAARIARRVGPAWRGRLDGLRMLDRAPTRIPPAAHIPPTGRARKSEAGETA